MLQVQLADRSELSLELGQRGQLWLWKCIRLNVGNTKGKLHLSLPTLTLSSAWRNETSL